jgi:hypothetical protein
MRLPRARPAAPTAVPEFWDSELNSARPAAPEPLIDLYFPSLAAMLDRRQHGHVLKYGRERR